MNLPLVALAGYFTGLAIGVTVCAVAWATTSHEHQFLVGAAL